MIEQPRVRKLVIDNVTVHSSPLFNREARKKWITPDGNRKHNGGCETPSSPYVPSKQAMKVKTIPQPDFRLAEPSSTPVDLRRPTPKYSQDISNSNSLLPKCTKPGVYTIPTIESLRTIPESRLKEFCDFTIKKDGVGSITFLKPIDLRGLDIDAFVNFSPYSINVYPDEEEKPEPGIGLNTKARISLEGCYPRDSITKKRQPLKAEDSTRFVHILQSM